MEWPQEIPPFERLDPRFRADPFPTYRYLQRVAPYFYREARDEWVISRYAGVVECLRHPSIGQREHDEHPRVETTGVTSTPLSLLMRVVEENQRQIHKWLLLRNPPDHTRLQRALHPAFSANVVASWRTQIGHRANALVESVEKQGEMELMATFAHPLPCHAISMLMDVPLEDMEQVREMSVAMGVGIEVDPSGPSVMKGVMAVGALIDYFDRLLASGRFRPTPTSVMGIMLAALADGVISRDELLSNSAFIFYAGHTTTEKLIGNGVAALLKEPTHWKTLVGEPQLLPSALNELIRYAGPFHVASRVALEDCEIGGVQIRREQRLVLLLAAANRDPAYFDAPDQLNFRRQPNPHLGFGRGIHHCLGARVGQMVAEEALHALITRLPTLAIRDDELAWSASYLIRGLDRLLVRW